MRVMVKLFFSVEVVANLLQILLKLLVVNHTYITQVYLRKYYFPLPKHYLTAIIKQTLMSISHFISLSISHILPIADRIFHKYLSISFKACPIPIKNKVLVDEMCNRKISQYFFHNYFLLSSMLGVHYYLH